LVRPPSAPPALISSSEATTTSSSVSADSSSTPAGVDPKLYQIVKRIVAGTPSLLVNGMYCSSTFMKIDLCAHDM
jgi:hypothetical protein